MNHGKQLDDEETQQQSFPVRESLSTHRHRQVPVSVSAFSEVFFQRDVLSKQSSSSSSNFFQHAVLTPEKLGPSNQKLLKREELRLLNAKPARMSVKKKKKLIISNVN